MDTEAGRRIIRVPLPVNLIREMDDLIREGEGGFRSRDELIEDAISERIKEVRIPYAPPEQAPVGSLPAAAARWTRLDDADEASQGRTTTSPTDARSPDMPQVRAPREDVEVIEATVARTKDAHLFGLHNKDFASLWAASQLAELGTSPQSRALDTLTQKAWETGAVLTELGELRKVRLSFLFPTKPKKANPKKANPKKAQSAENRFRDFAVGSVSESPDGVYAEGPLYQWQVIGVEYRGNVLHVGITPAGAELLADLDGLTPEEPHSESHARLFLNHLSTYAKADLAALLELLRLVSDHQPDRKTLLGLLAEAHPDWKKSQPSTNGAGYMARAREWGLVTPRLEKGTYRLTDFGQTIIKENAA